jgi:hypothetical protein
LVPKNGSRCPLIVEATEFGRRDCEEFLELIDPLGGVEA